MSSGPQPVNPAVFDGAVSVVRLALVCTIAGALAVGVLAVRSLSQKAVAS